jgi:hypothetical protein
LIAWGVVLLGLLIAFLMTWNAFFTYVPPGKHLVIISKDGEPLPTNDPEYTHVLAGPGQKGIQKDVKGEGWHFLLPIVYTCEVEDNVDVPAGKVGIVTALGGKKLPEGQLAVNFDQQGIQQEVLPPGSYRINGHGFKVDLVDVTEVKPGFVGVKRRLLAARPDQQKGIVKDEVLQPGLYYVNTKEFEVIRTEVGIFQTTFHKANGSGGRREPRDRAPITFTSKGGFLISADCTVEWEVQPKDAPQLVEQYGTDVFRIVEQNIIDLQVHRIGRDKGSEHDVQDLLEGSKREKFQADFTKELAQACGKKNVTILSAFIRQIDLPPQYLEQKQKTQIAHETELTNKVKEATAASAADVEREKRLVDQKVAEVKAETAKLVAAVDQEVENIDFLTQAEIDKLKAEYQQQIATLEAQKTEVAGQAEAEVKKLKDTAKSSIFQLKMDVFQNDNNAYLRYSMAEKLNDKIILRLFHSGPGTLWTNMDGKGVNLLLPAPGGTAPATKTVKEAGEK